MSARSYYTSNPPSLFAIWDGGFPRLLVETEPDSKEEVNRDDARVVFNGAMLLRLAATNGRRFPPDTVLPVICMAKNNVAHRYLLYLDQEDPRLVNIPPDVFTRR
jgi:hypothetical protein